MLGDFLQFLARNWALTSIVASLILLFVLCALIIRKYVRITVNILQEAPLPLSRKVRDFRPIRGDDVQFWATDGLLLRGTICLRPNTHEPPRGLIVCAPEYKSDRESVARYCRPLWEAGYDLFTFDFRNHGESAAEEGYVPRQWPSDREVADVAGALTYVEEWLSGEGRPVEYGVFGISRGAGAAIVAAAQRPTVKAIATDGAFSPDRVLEHYLKRYAEVFATVEFVYRNHPPEFWRFLRWCVFLACRRRFGCSFQSVQRAIMRMMPRPMLFIHGARDSYISESQSRLLYAVASQPRHLWIVPRAKHNQSVVVAPQDYARRTVDFFDLYLAGQPRPDNSYRAAQWPPLPTETPTPMPTADAAALAASLPSNEV